MEVKKSMPNARILEEKKKIVEDLTRKLNCKAGVFVNYSGITVNEDTEMRVRLREANVDYTVIKNTLMRFAIKNVGFDALDPILNGTTSLAVSDEDPIAPARIIKEYADKLHNYFEIKGGYMDGKILSVSEVNAIASIPALPILQAQLLGTMLAPIASLAVVLKAVAERGGAPVDVQVKVPDEESAVVEVAAEAPAEAPVEAVAEAPAEALAETDEAAPVKAPAKPRAKKPAPAEEDAATSAEAADGAAEAPAKPPAKPRAKKPASEETPD
jgi:large subunit ribosomal protein L10